MDRIVDFSGGACSFFAAERVVSEFGSNNVVLLFANTSMEDESLEVFVNQVASYLDVTLIETRDGRTPWDVFFDKRFLGNSRVDPCSDVLKRKRLDSWHRTYSHPSDAVIYVGLNWDEIDRFERFKKRMVPWVVEAPMCNPPLMSKQDMINGLIDRGITVPRLYTLGFPHNNCGGFCVKAGKAQFKLLLETMPERYAYHEARELELREFLGKDVTILTEQRDGIKYRLTLKEFRERLRNGNGFEPEWEFDWGGCGCAIE